MADFYPALGLFVLKFSLVGALSLEGGLRRNGRLEVLAGTLGLEVGLAGKEGREGLAGPLSLEDGLVVEERMEGLANLLISRYFQDQRCLTVVSELGGLKTLRSTLPVVRLELQSGNLELCRQQLQQFLIQIFAYKCAGYVVALKRAECGLLAWYDTYKLRSVARHRPVFLFMGADPEVLLRLPQTELSADILVAEVVEDTPSGDWRVLFSTNNFYEHPSKVERTPMIYLDEWHHETGFQRNANLYPDKILDLKGKPFRISTTRYLPYASADPIEGIDNRIAILFCQIHNCTPVAVVDDCYWGTIFDNFTGNGVLGNVYNDSSDLGTSAVYLWLNESYFLDYSASYLRGVVTVMLPKPTRIGGWLVPFLPFGSDMWLAFALSLLLSAVSLFLVTRASIRFTRFRDLLLAKVQFTTLGDSGMRAVGLAVLQTPSSRLIGDSPNRYLFTSFEFLYLVLSAMYSAELASFLTVPLYNPPIDKFHEFALSGIQWYAPHEAWCYALRETTDVDAKTVVNHFQVLPMEELKLKVKEGRFGFSAERLSGGSMTEQEHLTEDVIPLYHIMKEEMYGSPLVSAMKKGGPYNEYYDRVVNNAVDHGLTLFWEADVSRKYMNTRIMAEYEKAKSLEIDSSPTSIELSHMEGILYLYLLGILLATITFVGEVVHYRRTVNRCHSPPNTL